RYGHAERVRNPRPPARTVHPGVRQARPEAGGEAVDERRAMRSRRRELEPRETRGLAEPDEAGDVLRPGAAAALLRTARELRMEVDVAPHPKRADACRPAELVGGERQEVAAERVHVARPTAGSLHRAAPHARA